MLNFIRLQVFGKETVFVKLGYVSRRFWVEGKKQVLQFLRILGKVYLYFRIKVSSR